MIAPGVGQARRLTRHMCRSPFAQSHCPFSHSHCCCRFLKDKNWVRSHARAVRSPSSISQRCSIRTGTCARLQHTTCAHCCALYRGISGHRDDCYHHGWAVSRLVLVTSRRASGTCSGFHARSGAQLTPKRNVWVSCSCIAPFNLL